MCEKLTLVRHRREDAIGLGPDMDWWTSLLLGDMEDVIVNTVDIGVNNCGKRRRKTMEKSQTSKNRHDKETLKIESPKYDTTSSPKKKEKKKIIQDDTGDLILRERVKNIPVSSTQKTTCRKQV